MPREMIQNASSAAPPMTVAPPPSLLDRAVEIQKTETGLPIGSGILIAPQWVLTAGHLSRKPRAGFCAPLWVRHDATGVTKKAVWWRLFEKPVDLGMLYLGDTENIPGSIVPIEVSELAVGTRGWVAGYGETSGKLIKREFEVLSSHCGESGERNAYGCSPTIHVVIRGRTEKAMIHGGDSGAPFFVELEDGTLRLAGIVVRQSANFALKKAGEHPVRHAMRHTKTACRDGVCTRVDVHQAWIDETPELARQIGLM